VFSRAAADAEMTETINHIATEERRIRWSRAMLRDEQEHATPSVLLL
jgi:hypothetical protein